MAMEKRFEKIYSQGQLNVTEIWVDKVTSVNYLFHVSGYAGGMTPLLGPDGKPVIWPVTKSSKRKAKAFLFSCFLKKRWPSSTAGKRLHPSASALFLLAEAHMFHVKQKAERLSPFRLFL